MSTETLSRVRFCAWCSKSLIGKKSHAVYCTRKCKTKASDKRRKEDGRSIQRDRARYSREADKRRADARRYLRERPGKAYELALKRKLRMKAVPVFRFTEADWRGLLRQYDGKCAYCGVSDAPLQRDHKIPVSRGGSHGVGNIVPACAPCNYGKRTSLAIEWKLRLRREGR